MDRIFDIAGYILGAYIVLVITVALLVAHLLPDNPSPPASGYDPRAKFLGEEDLK